MASKLNIVDWIALILVFVGAINWGLVAFGYNLVPVIAFNVDIVMKVIYGLVGLAGLYLLYIVFRPGS